jgi:surface protein
MLCKKLEDLINGFIRIIRPSLFISINILFTKASQSRRMDVNRFLTISDESSRQTPLHGRGYTGNGNPSDFLPEIAGKEMDVLEMVLIERATGIPLDLIILIRSFLYEKLTNVNFFVAVELWFGDEEKCLFKFGHISDWNTSRVTNMEKAFIGSAMFDEDLSRWNVANVRNMSGMFFRASHFNGDLSRWDVSNVTNMSCMFDGATQFNGDLSRWDVSNVRNMRFMFHEATQFNEDLSPWDVANVTDMKSMFKGVAQFNSDICQWDVRNVQDMSQMFCGASHFDRDLSRWDIGRRPMWSTSNMFDGSPQLIERYTGT